MVEYNIVKHCRMCGIRYIVPRTKSKKDYCDPCMAKVIKTREAEAAADEKAEAEAAAAEAAAAAK